jgi:hypothetical protein
MGVWVWCCWRRRRRVHCCKLRWLGVTLVPQHTAAVWAAGAVAPVVCVAAKHPCSHASLSMDRSHVKHLSILCASSQHQAAAMPCQQHLHRLPAPDPHLPNTPLHPLPRPPNQHRVIKTAKQTVTTPMTYGEVVKMIIEKDGVAGLFGRGLRTKIITNGLQVCVWGGGGGGGGGGSGLGGVQVGASEGARREMPGAV